MSRQEVEHDPVAPLLEVFSHGPALLKGGVVIDHMDLLPPPQAAAKIIQMNEK